MLWGSLSHGAHLVHNKWKTRYICSCFVTFHSISCPLLNISNCFCPIFSFVWDVLVSHTVYTPGARVSYWIQYCNAFHIVHLFLQCLTPSVVHYWTSLTVLAHFVFCRGCFSGCHSFLRLVHLSANGPNIATLSMLWIFFCNASLHQLSIVEHFYLFLPHFLFCGGSFS